MLALAVEVGRHDPCMRGTNGKLRQKQTALDSVIMCSVSFTFISRDYPIKQGFSSYSSCAAGFFVAATTAVCAILCQLRKKNKIGTAIAIGARYKCDVTRACRGLDVGR